MTKSYPQPLKWGLSYYSVDRSETLPRGLLLCLLCPLDRLEIKSWLQPIQQWLKLQWCPFCWSRLPRVSLEKGEKGETWRAFFEVWTSSRQACSTSICPHMPGHLWGSRGMTEFQPYTALTLLCRGWKQCLLTWWLHFLWQWSCRQINTVIVKQHKVPIAPNYSKLLRKRERERQRKKSYILNWASRQDTLAYIH